MPVNVNQQTIVFLMCVLTGMVSGIVWDTLNISAKKLRFNKGAFFVQDIFIWGIILAFFFSVLYRINGAVLRWYVFLGAFLGVMLYIFTIRKTTINTAAFLINLVSRIIVKIIKVLLFPIRKMMRLFTPVIKIVQSARKRMSNFVQKNIEKIKRIKILLNKV